MLKLIPGDWKRRIAVHLGSPNIVWSLKLLQRFGFSPDHALDVGAFRGEWAKTCLDVFPDADITCIEPQKGMQTPLLLLADQNPNLHVIQTLLGSQEAAAVPFREEGSGSSVLLSPKTASTSPVTTIDHLISTGRCKPPNLLKLDVQGYEIEVRELRECT
jgi:FkbM family methyltransferase